MALLPAIAALAPLPAAAQGEIGTLASGRYACELPGDATGPVGRRVPDRDFEIVNASSYRTERGGGSYLRIGNAVTMTSGPFKGQRYRRTSDRLLRVLDQDGRIGPLRCLRRGSRGR